MEASSGSSDLRWVPGGFLITWVGCSAGSAGTRGALKKNTTSHHAAKLLRDTAWLPDPTARPLPPLRGPAWKGSKARLHGFLKLFCSPFPQLQQQWSPARESGSRGASARPRPCRCTSAAAHPAAICNPRSPALRAHAGSPRPEARLPSPGPARWPPGRPAAR